MKGHRTDWEDDNEGAHSVLGRRLTRGAERTGKTAMKGHRTDWEDGYEGAQKDWEDDNEGAQNGLGRRL